MDCALIILRGKWLKFMCILRHCIQLQWALFLTLFRVIGILGYLFAINHFAIFAWVWILYCMFWFIASDCLITLLGFHLAHEQNSCWNLDTLSSIQSKNYSYMYMFISIKTDSIWSDDLWKTCLKEFQEKKRTLSKQFHCFFIHWCL